MNLAETERIPVYMYHSCGVCTLRDCFNCLKRKEIEVVSNSSKLRKKFSLANENDNHYQVIF
jgi:hypothetical protein